jgi:hypothetical protein
MGPSGRFGRGGAILGHSPASQRRESLSPEPTPTGPRDTPDAGQPRPGVRLEFGETRAAASRLVHAHLDLLRAELSEIADELKRLVMLAGVAFALAVLLGLLGFIGGVLFLGEWLFGSIGWGVFDGSLLLVALLIGVGLVILGASGRQAGSTFLGGVIVAIVVAVVLTSNVIRHGAADLATRLNLALDPAWAPVIVAIVVGAIVVGIVLLIVGAAGAGGGGAVAGLIGGLILGALAGWLTGGIEFSAQGAAAIGVAAGAIAWSIFLIAAGLPGLDPAARFGRLVPRRSYEAALETKSYLEQEWARRRSALFRR